MPPTVSPGANPRDVSATSGLTAVALSGEAPNDRFKPSLKELRRLLLKTWFSWTVTICRRVLELMIFSLNSSFCARYELSNK